MTKTVHVTYGPDGKIYAASESMPPPRPAHVQGVTVGEFEVPTKFATKKLHEYIPHLAVEVETRRLKEKSHS